MRDVHQAITNAIVNAIDEAGQWSPCWVKQTTRPTNGVTGRRYQGVNVLALWIAGEEKGYGQQRWATLRQWNSVGCKVKKNEKATWVFMFKTLVKNEGTSDESRVRVTKEFPVFNADQCEGEAAHPPPLVTLREGQRFSSAEALILASGMKIINEGDQPRYIPKLDTIINPLFERFHSPKNYYATMFHEMGHATGHKSRLDRDLRPRFETHAYGMEELVAEMCSAFVCAHLGIESSMRDDHAPYLKSWLEVLKADKYAIVSAASAASKAADWLIDRVDAATIDEPTEMETV